MIKRFFPFILAALILISSIIIAINKKSTNCLNNSDHSADINNTSHDFNTRHVHNIENEEMKAVWVTFMSLDMKNDGYNEKNFKSKFDSIVSNCKNYGMNTLIVHIRPFSDSMYKSKIFPYSHLLTGTQGKDPGFDPLEYMVQATHNADMSFHAWINPLRIRLNGTPDSLADCNPYFSFKAKDEQLGTDYIINHDGNLYYNPGYPEVRAMIINGVKEVIENYCVDAIHFDDYFYPTSDPEIDKICYNNYLESVQSDSKPIDLIKWRCTNINSLISGVYNEIKSVNKDIQFGISPCLNLDKDIKSGADVYSWGEKSGYVDYLCPQIYVNFDHPVLQFDKSCNQWRNIIKNKDIKYYIGLGVYKAGSDADNGTWKNSCDILKREVEYSRTLNCDGFMLYSYDYLNNESTYNEVKNVMSVLNN